MQPDDLDLVVRMLVEIDDALDFVRGYDRKRFIGEITGAPVDQRLAGSLAVGLWSVLRGAAILRVHDVAATRAAVRMAGALAAVR